MKNRIILSACICLVIVGSLLDTDIPMKGNSSILDEAPDDIVYSGRYNSYKGLIMRDYQGWFNAPGDGAEKDWTHYQKNSAFKPGTYCVDCNRFMLNAKIGCVNCQGLVVKGHCCQTEK